MKEAVYDLRCFLAEKLFYFAAFVLIPGGKNKVAMIRSFADYAMEAQSQRLMRAIGEKGKKVFTKQ